MNYSQAIVYEPTSGMSEAKYQLVLQKLSDKIEQEEADKVRDYDYKTNKLSREERRERCYKFIAYLSDLTIDMGHSQELDELKERVYKLM